jgi:hypothetical protein
MIGVFAVQPLGTIGIGILSDDFCMATKFEPLLNDTESAPRSGATSIVQTSPEGNRKGVHPADASPHLAWPDQAA